MNVSVRELLDRYGPAAGLLIALIVLVALLPTGDGGGGGQVSTAQGQAGANPVGVPTTTPAGQQAVPSAGAGSTPAGGGTASAGAAPTAQGATQAASGGAPTAAATDPTGGAQVGSGGAASAAATDPSGGVQGSSAPSSDGGAASGGEAAPPPGALVEGGQRPKVDPPPGHGCRPEDGRQAGFSRLMPPCLPVFTGDNGGATAKGVFPDKIIVARWVPPNDPATSAALTAAGAGDNREDVDRFYDVEFRYQNLHIETYGREVVQVLVEASGAQTDDGANRADAVRIAEEVGAFAAINCTAICAEELAARDVICICATEMSRSWYARQNGHVFSALHVLDEYYESMAEYFGKRLVGKKAQWAGDPLIQAQDRKFGLIWLEDGFYGFQAGSVEVRDYYINELAPKWGIPLGADAGYTYDISRLGEQATNIIAQMKSTGVTTLAFVGDPLSPIFITKESTRQAYFPEWFISGTVLTDITFFGRAYDQAQWAHAFGQSPLWVFGEGDTEWNAYKEYYHTCPSMPEYQDRCQQGHNYETHGGNALREAVSYIFIGIHMAGPQLTSATYAQGMYNFPPTGGIPKLVLYDWTPEAPAAYKDWTEVFWDSQQRGRDEVGNEGVGAILKVDGGRRYKTGDWPTTEPKVFNREGAVFTTDDPPETLPHGDHEHPAEQRCLSCRH